MYSKYCVSTSPSVFVLLKALYVEFSGILFFFFDRIPLSNELPYWPSLSKLSQLRIELLCFCCGGFFILSRVYVTCGYSDTLFDLLNMSAALDEGV